jgi:RNA polymerase sigma-70 factor (ECF subfamily)
MRNNDSQNNYKGSFQDWEIAIAKKVVGEFRKEGTCLEREDFDDLLQECLTHWHFAKDDYDPTREANERTFMGRIIRNKLTDLIRERKTDKRKINHLAVSLFDPLKDNEDSLLLNEDPLRLIDTIDIENIPDADAPPNAFRQCELKIDLSKALQKLTPQQRELCRLIKEEGLNISEASEYLNARRSTVYDELKRIRTIFMKVGLDDYLK